MMTRDAATFGENFNATAILSHFADSSRSVMLAGTDFGYMLMAGIGADEEAGSLWYVLVSTTVTLRGVERARYDYAFTADQADALTVASTAARAKGCDCVNCRRLYSFVDDLVDLASTARSLNERGFSYARGREEIAAMLTTKADPIGEREEEEDAAPVSVALYSMSYRNDPVRGVVRMGRKLTADEAAAALPDGGGLPRYFNSGRDAAIHVAELQQKLYFKFNSNYPPISARSFVGDPPETF